MTKKTYKTVLCSTILVFVSIIAILGIMASYLLSYTPTGNHIPDQTIIRYDANNNPIVMKPSEAAEYNFLILGHDRMAVLTDVIMLVNYDVTSGSISVMQFPRDTYVSYGVPTAKINASYSTFWNEARNNGSSTPELDGLRKFADHLEEALCTKISFTAIMNLDAFRNIVDILGGVELEVPAPMHYEDPHQNLYIHLQPGYQTLDGEKAEQFVRFRYGYTNGDIGREDAQKIFISAFIKKAKDSISITDVGRLTDIAETVIENVYTDVTVSDFVYFAKNMLTVDMSKIKLVTAPVSSVSGGHVLINRAALLDIVNNNFNVYDSNIPDSIFDFEEMFYDNGNVEHINTYYSESYVYGGTEYNADSVNDDSIDLPRAY